MGDVIPFKRPVRQWRGNKKKEPPIELNREVDERHGLVIFYDARNGEVDAFVGSNILHVDIEFISKVLYDYLNRGE